MYLHQKFAFPVACLVFGLLALSLGVSNSKDSKHASFVVGLAVVFVFYALMMIGPSLTKAHVFPASLASWLPNIVLGLAGVALLVYRHRHADAGVQISLPSPADVRDAIERRLPWRRRASPAVEASAAAAREAGAAEGEPAARRRRRRAAGRRKVVVVIRVPRGFADWCDSPVRRCSTPTSARPTCGCSSWPSPACSASSTSASFIDWSDNLFKGQATGAAAGAVPVVLDAAVRLLRAAAVGPGRHAGHHRPADQVERADRHARLRRQPLSHGAAPAGARPRSGAALLFGLEESFLAASNRKAAELKHLMRGGAPRTFDVLARQWVAGRDGRHLPLHLLRSAPKTLSGLEVYRFEEKPWGLAETMAVRIGVLPGGGRHLARRPGLDAALHQRRRHRVHALRAAAAGRSRRRRTSAPSSPTPSA